MPWKRTASGAIMLLFIASCSHNRPEIGENLEYDPSRDRWAEYGAFYELDEVVFKIFLKEKYSYTWPGTSIEFNKRIRILNGNGLHHGTIKLPEIQGELIRFRLTLIDSAGESIRLNVRRLKKEFKKTRMVVFPKVTAGCVLSLNVKYDFDGYHFAHEHWMSDPEIPVLNARFALYVNRAFFDYEYKAYGNLEPPETVDLRSARSLLVWTKRRVPPRSRLDFKNFLDTEEPRVAIAARKVWNYTNLGTWGKHASKYEDMLLKTAFFKSNSEAKRIVDGILAAHGAPFHQADSLLCWVQKNISLVHSEYGKINPDKVIRSKRGNWWEIAGLMKEFCEYAGFNTDIIVSRSAEFGGFDPEFPSFSSLSLPLLRIEIGDKSHIAYPYSSSYRLGEYPAGFIDMKGLSLSSRTVVPLPGAGVGSNLIRYQSRIDGGRDGAEIELECRFEGFPAIHLREAALRGEKRDLRKYFDTLLTRIDPENRIDTLEINGQEGRGLPLSAKIRYANRSLALRRQNQAQYRLSPVFPDFFPTYDTSRTSLFEIRFPVEILHEVVFSNIDVRKVETRFFCQETKNRLFQVECRVAKDHNQVSLVRNVKLHKASLSAEEMRRISPEIFQLNRARQSYLTLK